MLAWHRSVVPSLASFKFVGILDQIQMSAYPIRIISEYTISDSSGIAVLNFLLLVVLLRNMMMFISAYLCGIISSFIVYSDL